MLTMIFATVSLNQLLPSFSQPPAYYYGHPMEQGRPLYFCPVVSFFYRFSSPNLSGRRLDVYHTSTHDVALV